MRARRGATLSVLCALLVACSAVESASPASHDPTIEGVGDLPAAVADTEVADTTVVASEAVAPTTTTVAATTTTLAPVPSIGALVTGNRLLMIGDSITASTAKRYGGDMCAALVPLGWQVEVDAEVSRFIDFGNQVLDRRLAAGWDAAYVFLGTNYFGDQQSYRKQLERIVQRLAPAPVLLLTVTLFEDTRQEVNDVITLVAAEFPNVHVLDWANIAAADAGTILRGDGHHLTNAGRAVLASNVAGVMGQAPVQPGKCLSTSFSNDSGGSVNGNDVPPKRKVGKPTPTTIPKPTTVTTVAKAAPTTVAAAAAPTTVATAAPTTVATAVPTTVPATATTVAKRPPATTPPTTTAAAAAGSVP